MMEKYLRDLDELISVASEVINVEIIRRSVWDTGWKRLPFISTGLR